MSIRRTLIATAVCAASVISGASIAAAAPSSQLPDADLFCGSALDYKVEGFIALSSAASQWIEDPVLGGHYLVLDVAHYGASGLLYAPVSDLSSLEFLHAQTYGSREGLSDGQVFRCQVVSRFPSSNVTVIAPITMVRVH